MQSSTPNCNLYGSTEIGERVTLETGSVIRDSIVGDETRVRPYSVIQDSRIGSRCAIGPMAHLRPGTAAADEVKIGNFVETKKVNLAQRREGLSSHPTWETPMSARTPISEPVPSHATMMERTSIEQPLGKEHLSVPTANLWRRWRSVTVHMWERVRLSPVTSRRMPWPFPVPDRPLSPNGPGRRGKP